MNVLKTCILCLVIIAALPCGWGDCRELAVLTENSGDNNYMDADGNLKGHNVEIVREIMARLGTVYPIRMVPWKRGYTKALEDPWVALFSTSRTLEREKRFKWVGPLHASRVVLYGKRGSGIVVRRLEDAKKARGIGCYRDDVREQLLKRRGFTNLESLYGSDANMINLKKVLLGRIDLWITSNKVKLATTRKMGIDPDLLEEVFVVRKIHAYVAFSRKTPDAVVHAWQRALDKIKEDGTYEKIMARYPTGMDSITFDPPAPVTRAD